MKITTKGRYGLRAVLYLASSYFNRPVSIKTIAEEEKISPEFLEQIFFKLKKRGIISSLRGPGGGFVLNRKTSEITVLDILDALGESVYIVPCTETDEQCEREEVCLAHSIWRDLSCLIKDYLTRLTIKDVLDKKGKKYYEELKAGQNFSI